MAFKICRTAIAPGSVSRNSYSASSVSLAALEKFVQLEGACWPALVLVAIDIPDSSAVYCPTMDELPAGWDAMPTSGAAQGFGVAWISSGSSVAIAVPSVIAPEEHNVLLNPVHPDFAKVGMSVVRRFLYEERMLKTS
jgi:RES domain-containing protein